jgi:hypothetical protein
MKKPLLPNEVFGFIKPIVDVHTLGISTIANLLKDCGYKVLIAPDDVSESVITVQKVNSFGLLKKWVVQNKISRLGFSYRLDPNEGKEYFCRVYYLLKENKVFEEEGGFLKEVFFAGLPDTCELIKRDMGSNLLVFKGDEPLIESLTMLGVPSSKLPGTLVQDNDYDTMRWRFAADFIASEKYKKVVGRHLNDACGALQDSYLDRLHHCRNKKTLPIIRAHVGPYNPNRLEAIKEFISWEKDLAGSGLLDVLSIGTSQLTQSHFGESWDGLPNGGGVPVKFEHEYASIKEAAKPMLVRTYAGTKDVPHLAAVHERALNICWHALSFWWFCEIDGRGKNTVLENLKEHIETIKYIAQTGKPLEPNVPHHFSFRGGDDITYILSAYLAAKTAKKYGIRHLILQNMLNTPKHTCGVQDLAKGRLMLRLVSELEDSDFKVSLQTRAGLDYFAPDLEKAKVQLAAVTAMMDDIDPGNSDSPQIIHVVSYSEAVRLATPPVIKESIQITLGALKEYRLLRKKGKIPNMEFDQEVRNRFEDMYEEAKAALRLLEKYIPNLYTAKGLYRVFDHGFFPVPYLSVQNKKYSNATKYSTAIKDGGIRVVDDNGNVIRTSARYKKIIANT